MRSAVCAAFFLAAGASVAQAQNDALEAEPSASVEAKAEGPRFLASVIASPILPGAGFSGGYRLTPKIWGEGSAFNRHTNTNPDNSLEVETLIEGGARFFVFNSFNLRAGVAYRRKTVNFDNGSGDEHEAGVRGEGNAMVVAGALGNQWLIGQRFVLGADWLELYAPSRSGKMTMTGMSKLSAERKDFLAKKADAYNSQAYPGLVKVRMGWAF